MNQQINTIQIYNEYICHLYIYIYIYVRVCGFSNIKILLSVHINDILWKVLHSQYFYKKILDNKIIYLLIITSNNLLHRIYCKKVVKML